MKNLFTNASRGLALTTLLAAGTLAAHAQNVGIGTTAPDVSAALDIVSTSKGALLPRVASTAAVPTPATGLIVYQTGGTAGYYYNAGTPGAPNWQQFATASGAAVTASNGLTKTGANIALGGTLTGATTIAQAGNNFTLTGVGNVGIGTAGPNQKLEVATGGIRAGGFGAFSGASGVDQGAHLQWNRSGFEGETWLINHLGLGAANAGIRFAGITTATGTVPTEWARFLNNGYFGIGTTAPRTLLDLGSAFGATPSDPAAKKLSVYNDSGFNFYGLGVSGNQLNFYAATGAGANDAPGLVLRNNGNVGIGMGNAAPSQKLDVASGGIRAGANGAFAGAAAVDQGAHLQWNRSGFEGETWLINHLGLGGANAGIRFAGITTATGTVPTEWARFLNNGFFGIGTTAPSQKLDVTGGSVKISTAGQGLIFPDGTTQTTAAVSAATITANNGLTKTGSNIALGGPLTGATTIAQAGNNFSLTGGKVGIGTATPNSLLDLGDSYGLTPSDPLAKKLAVYNDGSNNFYGVGVSASQLNLYASSTPTAAPLMALNANGNVGIGLGNAVPAVKLDVNGGVNIQGANTLEFGAGVAGKEVNAGKIGYQALNVGALDISGAGTTATNRRIRFYNEGGASFTGRVGIATATPNALLDLGDSYGLTPSDPTAKKLAVYTDASFNFYGMGVSASQLNIYASAAPTAAPVMAFNANGNVGIGLGNAIPTYKLEVAGDINAIGQVRANGVVLTSDARFKQQVRPLGGALAAVRALRGVRYTWNALGIRHGGQAGAEQVGVLAQELEKVFPELVSTGPDGYKAVNYAQLTPVLIEAIKEQQQQIEVLKAQNATLQGRSAQAEADHASLQTLQAQMARLLGEAPANAQARK